ncbi:YgfZ/GcvT domain-containing protein [Actomonas aquatica]|uniref:Aminomethyltransferase folate-binding domain-containing protein n=1 Tax=Actomonas aquatica TaxID=2866162 RepID=A0ABZ1C461_9BACT|nr:hypothetical protein [Opitutus sp. WL0086]WRQ86501.1 hypothetical protein K1X11_016920 [Opitutus sp. WL0086]
MRGEDAAEFLQGQFSQDLRGLASGGVAYGFWLGRTGKVEGDSWIVAAGEDAFRVFSRSLLAGALIERLERFIIADDVELADETAAWEASWWSEAAAVEPGDSETSTYVLREGGGLLDGSVIRLVKRREGLSAAELGADAGASQVSEAEVEAARIAGGVPRVPVDIGPNDLPQEGGLETIGVSFNKGCYLGQEVMARLKTTGRVRRRLVVVSGDGEVPAAAASELKDGDKVVAELRSRVGLAKGGWVGLAMAGAALAGQEAGELQRADGGGVVSWRSRGVSG